jgi:DNA polymerase III subunit delta
MNFAEFDKSLAGDELPSFILVYGAESFFRTEALKQIKQAAATDMDLQELEPEKLDIRDLLDGLRTPGLFAAKRLIIVDRAEKFITAEGEALIEYAKSPSSSSTLVLAAETLDARRKHPKALIKAATAINCAPIKDHEVPKWVADRARSKGKSLDMTTAKLLVELAGSSLGQLDGQLDSLSAYCDKRKKITYEDVETLVGGDHARRIWDMTDAVMNRDAKKALKCLDRLMREPGGAEFGIIAALSGKVRDMLTVKRLTETGMSQADIRSSLGKHPYVIKLLCNAVSRIPLKELAAKYRLLLTADIDMKTLPNRERRWVLERLALRLCGLRA